MAYFNKLGTIAWANEIMAMITRLENEGAKLNMRETIERRQAIQVLNRKNERSPA